MFSQIGAHTSVKNFVDRKFFDISFLHHSTFIGLLLIIVGIIFLLNPINLHLKVSASMILLGLLCILLFDINEKSVPKAITGQQLTIIIALWIFLAFITTYNFDADLSLIIVILGILIIKEFLSDFMSPPLKKRMTFLFYLLIFTFAVVIGQRIINIIII